MQLSSLCIYFFSSPEIHVFPLNAIIFWLRRQKAALQTKTWCCKACRYVPPTGKLYGTPAPPALFLSSVAANQLLQEENSPCFVSKGNRGKARKEAMHAGSLIASSPLSSILVSYQRCWRISEFYLIKPCFLQEVKACWFLKAHRAHLLLACQWRGIL